MKIADVIDFAERNGGGNIFTNWLLEEVEAHLAFHAQHGTLLVVESKGHVDGFAVYRRIKQPKDDISDHFWEPSNGDGQHVYWHELCSNNANARYTLLREFEKRNKDARKLTYWGHRKDKLTRYSYKDFRRLMTWEDYSLNQKHQNHPTTLKPTERRYWRT